jgi:hypothetical protein
MCASTCLSADYCFSDLHCKNPTKGVGLENCVFGWFFFFIVSLLKIEISLNDKNLNLTCLTYVPALAMKFVSQVENQVSGIKYILQFN